MESAKHLNSRRKQVIKISIDKNQNGRVIVGLGAGREGNGCRTSLYHIANRLAEQSPALKVCLVDYHLAEPTLDKLFVPDPNKLIMHLDKLYKSINNEITESIIISNVILNKNQKNLYLLPGTRRPYAAESLNADVLLAITEGLKHIFDVVIVNTSAHFDNPGTIAGLLSADHVLVFSNYDESGLRIFNQYYSTIFEKHTNLKDKMLLVGVNSRNGKKESLSQLSQIKSFHDELPFIDQWKFSFSEKQKIEGKAKSKYIKTLDQIINEIGCGVIYESDNRVKERKWRIWPIMR